MPQHRFNVFGRLVAVERSGASWKTWSLGPDGKRSPADFVVPDFVAEDELAQYLADLFHEDASPTNGEVRRLG